MLNICQQTFAEQWAEADGIAFGKSVSLPVDTKHEEFD